MKKACPRQQTVIQCLQVVMRVKSQVVPLQILLSERVLKQVKDLLNLLAVKKGRQLC